MNFFDFIFPKRCLGCGRIGKYFCDLCKRRVRLIQPNETICPVCEKSAIDGATHPRCRTRYSLDGLTSFFHYDGIIRKAIKSLKYRLVSNLASEFVSLVDVTKLRYNDATLIPIPLHRSRFMERGFNQTEVLGRLIAGKLHIPMRTDILMRTKKTMPQVEMRDRNERISNMKDVFVYHNSLFTIHTSGVLLFDDVFTTGATMRSAANVLKRNGVKYVWAVTMAR